MVKYQQKRQSASSIDKAGLLHDPEWGKIQKKKPRRLRDRAFSFVGVAGFEPATLWSQTRCANRAALHPDSTFEGFYQNCRKSITYFHISIIPPIK